MWIALRASMTRLDAVRVENACDPGTPDVDCTLGWIELKNVDELPVRPDTPLRVPHFVPAQRAWLIRRSKAGGRCFVMLRAAGEWILMRGDIAALRLGKCTIAELRQWAFATWPSVPDEKQLTGALRECK